MKIRFLKNFVTIFLIVFKTGYGQSQTIDTLVDVGGYKLHFHIIKGKGMPILFEAGGGEDATTWEKILIPIAEKTGATIVAYDRTGFGQSTFDTKKHGILNGIKGLETGQQKLGFNGNIMLVAHSQGGLYATIYASRHADKVKAAVLIDVTTACFYEKNLLATTQQSIEKKNSDGLKKARPGIYYQGADFSNNINFVRSISFPATIPVTDFVSEHTPFSNKKDSADWKRCHQEFVAVATNRQGIIAYKCGHFIFNDNPPLVINAIVRLYAEVSR